MSFKFSSVPGDSMSGSNHPVRLVSCVFAPSDLCSFLLIINKGLGLVGDGQVSSISREGNRSNVHSRDYILSCDIMKPNHFNGNVHR